jgi:hypothetical protein
MTYSKLLAIVVTTLMFNGIKINEVPTASSDLMTLKAVIEGFNSIDQVNVNEVLASFKKYSGLKVSNSDLLTYFSNLGVRFYTEA